MISRRRNYGPIRRNDLRLLAALLAVVVCCCCMTRTVVNGFAPSAAARRRWSVKQGAPSVPKFSSGLCPLFMSSELRDDSNEHHLTTPDRPQQERQEPNFLESLLNSIQEYDRLWQRRPPIKVEDINVLFYDIFLIINLAVSISFWVVHRMDFAFIGTAFNEGCLMSLLWIGAGLYSGAFLNSAVDGHFVGDDEKGGPQAAGMLAFQTFVNAINLRLIFALAVAVIQHRPVGSAMGEQIMPLEIGFGLIMMSTWRILHSSYVPRL